MGNGYVPAKDEFVDLPESFKTVFYLLRIAMYHIIYLRGILPERCFDPAVMDYLDGIEIRMLREYFPGDAGVNSISQKFFKCVEVGLKEALEKKYLRKLAMMITDDYKRKNTVEEYIFEFEYGSKGVSMEMVSRDKTKGANSVSKASVRFQAIRLIRTLILLCNTLDRIPADSADIYVNFHTWYNESAPAGYIAPHFVSGAKEDKFAVQPSHMEIGAVSTGHHAMSISVDTLMDSQKSQTSSRRSSKSSSKS